MKLHRSLLCFAVVLLMAATTTYAEEAKGPKGTYRVKFSGGGGSEITVAVLKIEEDGGKLKGTLVASHPALTDLEIKTLTREGSQLTVVLKSSRVELGFEGKLGANSEKSILGSMTQDGESLTAASMTTTDLTALEQKDIVTAVDLPQVKAIATATSKQRQLQSQAAQEKDAAKKGDLLTEAKEQGNKIVEQYRELVEKNTDSYAVVEGVQFLLKQAGKDEKQDLAQVKKMIAAAEKIADAHGTRYAKTAQLQLADALSQSNGVDAFALEYAQNVDKKLTDKDPLDAQMRIAKALLALQKKAGKADEVKALEARIAKIDEAVDKQYLTKVPPFKPEMYTGRTSKSKRAVVMELFTGAQCPPCVAADVAFDALEKSFKPSELILIQYHVHIPGPDPLTSPESVARMKFYSEAYPGKIGGTPSTLFNGKPDAGGGGGMANAEAKYKQYRKLIEPLVEENEGATVSGSAKLSGDKIDISIEVKDLKDAGENMKLRLLLVEETVRYVGGNRLRFHHQVVRAFPGGIEGSVLKEKESKHNATVDLAELRTKLNEYLDNYAKTRSFSNPERPMDFKHLHVIALVQDDKTFEIVQALQLDVK